MPEQERFANCSIFDLDHTLCTVNTSFYFGLYLWKKGVLSSAKIPFLLGCYACQKIGILSILGLHKQACRHLFYGKIQEDLKRLVNSFLDENFNKILNPTLLSLLNRAISEGHYTVLLSSSPDFLVEEVAKRLTFHEWAATEYFLQRDRKIQGVGSPMEGASKAGYVRKLMKRQCFEKEKITAYSDSFLDIPLLEEVGIPVVVNPDRKLKSFSKKQVWKILNC